MKNSPKTPVEALKRGLLVGLVTWGLLALGAFGFFVLAPAITGSSAVDFQISSPAPKPTTDTNSAKVDRLVERFECWTDGEQAPQGVIPSRAIVQLPQEGAKVAPSQVGFDLWLGADEEPNTGDERDGRLHAFCP